MHPKELISYSHYLRRLYFDAMAKLPWTQVVEPRGLSFNSMRDVFLHLTMVEDRWISYIIPGRFKDWVDPEFDTFKDMESLEQYMRQVHDNTDTYISKLTDAEVHRSVVIPWGPTPGTKISIDTALTHLICEDMIHYGELSAALWQMGLEAPYKGFLRFHYVEH